MQKFLNKAKWFYLGLLFAVPLITLLLTESVHRGSFTKALAWIPESSFSFLISYLFFFLFISALAFTPKKLFIPLLFIQLFLWLTIAVGSYKKYQLRGDYFNPTDLTLIKEGVAITSYINGLFTWKYIIAFILFITLIVGIIYVMIKMTEPLQFKLRVILSLLSIAGLTALLYNPTVFSLRATPANNVEEYEKLGLVGGFLSMREKTKIVHPEEYTKSEIKKITGSLKQTTEVDENFKPNVIVVLAEAFWDPLLMTNLQFEKDPIPFYRSMTEQSSSGQLVTHTYGGGTINTEMEILTGLSTRFLPEGNESFNSQITRPIDSLAHNFRNQGYNTTAVHTFKNWFYDRNLTYRWLGFEKFVSMEFFSNPAHIGSFIDDRDLMKQTLSELKKTKGPDFINTVTVSSHGPYDDIRYEDLKSCGNTPKLSKVPQYVLDLYCQVLSDTDDALRVLVEGVEKLDEPTMIVVYGDHLPMLGYDYAVYREANYFKSLNSYEDYMKLHETPLVVWDNFSKPEEKEQLKMTPNFLGSYILSHAKKEKSPIFQASSKVYEQGSHVIPKTVFNAQEGIDEAILKDYKLLQYDILFGDQYNYSIDSVEPVKNFLLGSERMTIKKVTVSGNKLTIKGKNFVFNTKVFIDGKEQDISFVSESKITVTTPKKLEKDKQVKIILKVLDDRDTSISESNEITFQVD
ncbi:MULTISPECIES: sulfatase-like hydrolase/transferase [unclassified Bacillus (in: firmicutes)]|uniref:sulfatase-like hydrolase/transferase n=1 Tax=unclassified Bacillus (in: firmicutes) TaxID=185979 RepID=UPI0008F131B3|nr:MULTISPECIES: sulfatase-like hydrolase/transferase [unclassified Bacillus (in: firmicutes)]SFB25470.1 Phosphoglycerol transferase MdoB [Bacillus sp. UNCCL13]SFQ91754.1 Phosphoglycerol transferase MdoB [Bacillus sp. cl95]